MFDDISQVILKDRYMDTMAAINWEALIERMNPKLAPVPLNSAQAEGVVAVLPFLARGQNSYIDMPPRSGKTGLFLSLIEIMHMLSPDRGPRALIMTGSDYLRGQIMGETDFFAPRLCQQGGILELDEGKKLPHFVPPVTITTYEMIVGLLKSGRISLDNYDLIIKDEGHASLSELRRDFFIVRAAPHIRQIAFTATPEYYIGKSLSEAGFQEAYHLSVYEAQKRKILAPHQNIKIDIDDENFSFAGIDISAAEGDYDQEKTEKVVNQARLSHIFAEFLVTWRDPVTKRALKDMTGIVACNSIEHAQNFAGIVNQRRMAVDFDTRALCMPIWGTMPGKAKRDLIEKHKSGELRVLACEKLLLTGYDNPLIEYIL